MRDMFMLGAMSALLVVVVGWKCWLVIADNKTTRTQAAFCGGVLAVLATTAAAVIWMLPN